MNRTMRVLIVAIGNLWLKQASHHPSYSTHIHILWRLGAGIPAVIVIPVQSHRGLVLETGAWTLGVEKGWVDEFRKGKVVACGIQA